MDTNANKLLEKDVKASTFGWGMCRRLISSCPPGDGSLLPALKCRKCRCAQLVCPLDTPVVVFKQVRRHRTLAKNNLKTGIYIFFYTIGYKAVMWVLGFLNSAQSLHNPYSPACGLWRIANQGTNCDRQPHDKPHDRTRELLLFTF